VTSSVVVTGAAGGIGRAVVTRLARNHHVVATDVVAEVSELGADNVTPVVADVTSGHGRLEILAAAKRALAGLVNVVGITRDSLVNKMSEHEMRQVLRVNAAGPIEMSLAAADAMGSGGSIVQISSRSHLGNIGQVNYAASKGALIGATQALARTLAPRIRVNAIAPGLIQTPMTDAMPPDVLDKLVGRIPRGRIGHPSDVAAMVAHLLSQDADYVTGQTIYVCGGRSI